MDESSLGTIVINWIIVFLLLLVNAFFVAAEFAIVRARKAKIEQLTKDGNVDAKLALKALEDMKWKKEMEERVQEILESVKACEKKIEETAKEENNGENKEGTEQTAERQTAEKPVEEEIQQETKQEVINDPVVPE